MNWITEPERRTPVVSEVDLLICGGGFAGVAAAISAAKNGIQSAELPPRQLNITRLQKTLMEQGMNLVE